MPGEKTPQVESHMAGPFQLWTPKPVPQPNGITTELPCDDVDALDAALSSLAGEALALSDGHGPDANGDLTWMLPKVIPLTRTGTKPYVTLNLDFKLLSHSKGRDRIDMVIEGDCGTPGELRLRFSSSFLSGSGPRGWQLHLVTPHPIMAAPLAQDKPLVPPELADEPEEDAEDAAKRRRDDIFKKMFS